MRGCRTMLRWNTRPRRSTSPTWSLRSGPVCRPRPPDGRPPLVLAREEGAPGAGFGFGAGVGSSPAWRRARSMEWRRRAAARSLRATNRLLPIGRAAPSELAPPGRPGGRPAAAGRSRQRPAAPAAAKFAWMVRGAPWRRRADRLLAEAALPLGVGAQRPQEVDLAEVRPVGVGEVVLRVGRLPQQEAGQADLPRGADDQVGVGHPGGVQVPGDLVGGQAAGRVRQLEALLGVLAEQAADRLGD